VHPKELSSMAIVAAFAARQDEFKATADAFLALAAACDEVARVENQLGQATRNDKSASLSLSDQDLVFLLN
jgi:hypothetical protein